MEGSTETRARRSQEQRRDATTGQLIEAARALFARDGYAGTSLDAIVSSCGVTKGALYHHFEGKTEIFAAVFREEQRRMALATAKAYAGEDDPLEGLFVAWRAFLDVSQDPGVQRITMLDAPSVLGWERIREIESEYGMRLLKEGLRLAMKAGRLPRRDIDSLAHILFGALCEAAMMLARAGDQRAARRKIERELRALLDGLAGG